MAVASVCGCIVLVAHVCDLNLLAAPGQLRLLCTNVLIENCCLHVCVIATLCSHVYVITAWCSHMTNYKLLFSEVSIVNYSLHM